MMLQLTYRTLAETTLSSPKSTMVSIFLFAIISIILLRKFLRKSIPSPNIGLPFIGDALGYAKDPVDFVRQATVKCGQIFRINMILNNIVFLRGTELNKMYLNTREEVWSFGDGMVG